MPAIKDSFCIVQLIDATDLQRANLRSLLKNSVYIETGNNFFISLETKFKKEISKGLKDDQANFILAFTSLKAGADVLTNGIGDGDKKMLAKMIRENP
jgi:hypothetical protein